MKMKDVFPSDYIKVEDVSGKGEEYTIRAVNVREFTDPATQEIESKPVVWFHDTKKGLILNKTNWERIAAEHGDESDNWSGKVITLHLEKVQSFGKTMDAVRVKGK